MAFCPLVLDKIALDPILSSATDSFSELCQIYANNVENGPQTTLTIAQRMAKNIAFAQRRKSAWADKLHDKGAQRRVEALPETKPKTTPKKRATKPQKPKSDATFSLSDAFNNAKPMRKP